MNNSLDKITRVLFIFVSVLVLSVVIANFYTYFVQKDYFFTVEASCDPAEQTCFVRDCNDEECPPNEFEIYRLLSIKASDFDVCTDNSCLNECSTGLIECEETLCDKSVGDACSVTTEE